MQLTEQEKIVFTRIWIKSQPGNTIYDSMSVPQEKTIIDSLVEQKLLVSIAIRFVKFSSEGVKLGLEMFGGSIRN